MLEYIIIYLYYTYNYIYVYYVMPQVLHQVYNHRGRGMT